MFSLVITGNVNYIHEFEKKRENSRKLADLWKVKRLQNK